jgi:hypothetical protein
MHSALSDELTGNLHFHLAGPRSRAVISSHCVFG